MIYRHWSENEANGHVRGVRCKTTADCYELKSSKTPSLPITVAEDPKHPGNKIFGGKSKITDPAEIKKIDDEYQHELEEYYNKKSTDHHYAYISKIYSRVFQVVNGKRSSDSRWLT